MSLAEMCEGCREDEKACPGCGIGIHRYDGCNNVVCRCGQVCACVVCTASANVCVYASVIPAQAMCWVCGDKVIDHDRGHFVSGFFGATCVRTAA